MKENPKITILELSEKIILTQRAIKKNIKQLKERDKIKRIGPDKGGYWEVIE
jgi:ATP-dependent DNA helicase RecG